MTYFSSDNMKKKKEEEESSLKDQLNSIQEDMLHSKYQRMLE